MAVHPEASVLALCFDIGFAGEVAGKIAADQSYWLKVCRDTQPLLDDGQIALHGEYFPAEEAFASRAAFAGAGCDVVAFFALMALSAPVRYQCSVPGSDTPSFSTTGVWQQSGHPGRGTGR
jgi:hypothetical protein